MTDPDFSGRMIKGYELHEQIDVGGFGAIYRAVQPLVEREVAIKIILPRHANNPEFIRRFEIEAHLVARLEHPYIVPLYDYWRDPDGAYLVMRWLRGGNLHARLARGPLGLGEVAQMLEEVGGALASAHRRGVVHRDLKPSNVLLDEEGHTYLADFGIAKDIGPMAMAHQTNSGVLIGSPAYISPEQIENQPISAQTDIYSLGLVLYEVLTGELPFKSTTPVGFYFQHIHDPVPSLRRRRPDLPPALDALIQRATAKQPTARYPDMLSLIEDMRRVLALAAPQAPPGLPAGAVNQRKATRAPTGYETVLSQPLSMADGPLAVAIENPYKGLRAFQEADAGDFFGREALVQHLLARLGRPGPLTRFLAVVGPSGSGKSSVVRAGIVPALRKGVIPGSERWFVVDMLPNTAPLEELATALLSVAVNRPDDMLAQLAQDEYGLLRVLNRVLPLETELLLVIDQFEEVFTLVEDESARTHFLNSLSAAVTAPGTHLRVIVTLRGDFYDRPLLYPGFSELVRRRTEVVVPLEADEIRRAITLPAQRASLVVEPDLVETLVRDVGAQAGALPLLQYALTELFERRSGQRLTSGDYRASGGLLGALARRADEIYESLTPAAADAARQLFLRLVTLGEGTEDTRRRVALIELESITNDAEALHAAIDAYAAYRLLTFDRDPATRAPSVEVAHEALIRSWGRLRAWIDASRDDLRTHRRLSQAVAEWQNANRDKSYLARDARLEQFAAWSQETQLALSQSERDYIAASMEEQEAQRAAEARSQVRVLGLERRSRWVLRALIAVLLVATLGALTLSAVAFQGQSAAENSAATATVALGSALFQERLSQSNAATAIVAQGQDLVQAVRTKLSAAEARNQALAAAAEASLARGNTDDALTLAVAGNQLPPTLLQEQRTLSQAAYTPGTHYRMSGHDVEALCVSVSPDGSRAASGDRSGALLIWDLSTGARVRAIAAHSAAINGVAWSPDGRFIATASADKTLSLWDATSGQQLAGFSGHAGGVTAVAWSPDGRQIVSASNDTSLLVWDAASGRRLRALQRHTQAVLGVAWSLDGRQIASASNDTSLLVWNAASGEVVRALASHSAPVNSVAWNSNSTQLLSGSTDTRVLVWDAQSGSVVRTLSGNTRGVNSVAWSADGSTAIAGAEDGKIAQWDVASGTMLRFLAGHGSGVTSLAFRADGTEMVSASRDHDVRLWDLTNGAVLRALRGHRDQVMQVVWSPDGKLALTSGGRNDRRVIVWDVVSGRTVGEPFGGHNGAVEALAISPDGAIVASGGGLSDGTILLWSLATRQTRPALNAGRSVHTLEIHALAFSPDGNLLLSASGDVSNNLGLWDVRSGTFVRYFEGHTQGVNDVAFSPDGRLAISASQDQTLIVWDVANGVVVSKLAGHTAGVSAVAWSPDGTQVLSGGADRLLILWDVASGKRLRRLAEHGAEVQDVRFSPDGVTALSASNDTTLLLWNVRAGAAIRRYEGHNAAVRAAAFAPDGASALSASDDGSVLQWRIDTLPALLAWVTANRYVPEFTCDQMSLYGGPACPTPEP